MHCKQKIRCTLHQASQYEPWKSKYNWFSPLKFSPLSQWRTVWTLCSSLTGSREFLGFCHFYFCVAQIVCLVYSHRVYFIFTPLAFLPNDIYCLFSAFPHSKVSPFHLFYFSAYTSSTEFIVTLVFCILFGMNMIHIKDIRRVFFIYFGVRFGKRFPTRKHTFNFPILLQILRLLGFCIGHY